MEIDFEVRRKELLAECKVAPEIFGRVMPRLKQFMSPFVEDLTRKEQKVHAEEFVQGLLSTLDHKNAESIAYLFEHDRMPMQWFMVHKNGNAPA